MLIGSSSAELLEPGKCHVSSWRGMYWSSQAAAQVYPHCLPIPVVPRIAQHRATPKTWEIRAGVQTPWLELQLHVQHRVSTLSKRLTPLWVCCQPWYRYLILTQSLVTATITWGTSYRTKTVHKGRMERKSCCMSPLQDTGPRWAATPQLLFLHTSENKCLSSLLSPTALDKSNAASIGSEAVPSGSIFATSKEDAQFLLSLPFKQLVWRGRAV